MTERPARLDRLLWPAVATLGLMLVLFEVVPIDLWLQDRFFDFEAGTWLVDRDAPAGRAVFYTGPKHALVALGIGLMLLLAGPEAWRRRVGMVRRDLAIAVLALAFVPTLIGTAKSWTNVFCPSEIRRYGGDAPYVKLLERHPTGDQPARRGRCFPAGHASGGFALFGLAWLRRSRRWRTGSIALALGLGWTMGLYQMFKGAHFLSHTVTTMLVAWVCVLAFRRLAARGSTRLTAPGSSRHSRRFFSNLRPTQ
jgi:membrane-associated PAP2 superfamily phosphatase